MPIVLVQRILEAVLLPKQTLRPLGTLHVTEDPAIHVLSFDDKNAVFGDDDVVDLRCAVHSLQGDVVQREINLGIEQQLLGDSTHSFANPTFDERS